MIQKIELINDKVKYKIDLSTAEGAAVYGSTTPPPLNNTTLGGWLFTTTSTSDKFTYLFKGHELTAPLLLRNLRYFFVILTCESVQNTLDVPYLRLRTAPTGSGDASPEYHSQIDYSLNPTKYKFFNTEKCVLWAGNQSQVPDIFPNLRKIRLDDVLVDGDGNGGELLTNLYVKSLDGVAAGKLTTVHNLGWLDNLGFYQNIKLV